MTIWTKKSFYLASTSDLAGLEQDKNYVITVLDSDDEIQLLRQGNTTLVWVGEDIPERLECQLVVGSNESEEMAQQKLNQVVLRELSQQERPSWDEYFMKIAQVASMRSNCIKRKVGRRHRQGQAHHLHRIQRHSPWNQELQ